MKFICKLKMHYYILIDETTTLLSDTVRDFSWKVGNYNSYKTVKIYKCKFCGQTKTNLETHK